MVIDINQTKHAQEELRLGLERYKIVMEQTNDIFFEWDVETDTVAYSSNWKTKFGYDPISTRASERIPKISHLHPEDMAPLGHSLRKCAPADVTGAGVQGIGFQGPLPVVQAQGNHAV